MPFDILASDGITYHRPKHRSAYGNPKLPDVTSLEAYLSLGGGMREAVVVQFPRAGLYSIMQRSIAFDDGVPQLLATVNVTDEAFDCWKSYQCKQLNLEQFTLDSARPLISKDRKVVEYRGLSLCARR